MKLNKFNNKSILILGYGVTGQDVYAAIGNNNTIYIVDDNNYEIESVQKIYCSKSFIDMEIKLDFIIKSPGIRYDNPVILAYNKTPIINDVEVAYEVIKQRSIKTIAITGTNGKTSTTTFITSLLNNAGYNAFSCGNIGISPLRILKENECIDFLVLELSSFQLKAITSFTPDFAVFMNFTPDHLDYHENLEDYYHSKLNIFYNNNQDMKIYLGNNIEYVSAFDNIRYPKTDLSEKIRSSIHGIYYENIELIYPLAMDLGITDEQIIDTLKNKFPVLPHRMEYIATVNGVVYINDSKATNVVATSVALKQYKNIILITGGYDKKEDIKTLGNYLSNVKKLICYGENKSQFIGLLEETIAVNTLNEALVVANDNAIEGDTILLSPASASYDMFKNYEERGNLFRKLVETL
jgi:UDP-N-acetylmuramoylalanine--D-glutamate ligase